MIQELLWIALGTWCLLLFGRWLVLQLRRSDDELRVIISRENQARLRDPERLLR